MDTKEGEEMNDGLEELNMAMAEAIASTLVFGPTAISADATHWLKEVERLDPSHTWSIQFRSVRGKLVGKLVGFPAEPPTVYPVEVA